jgi:hypothetical protein
LPSPHPRPFRAVGTDSTHPSRNRWQPRHRTGLERGDRALGVCVARRLAWAIGLLWPLGLSHSSRPWAKIGTGTVLAFIHYPKSVFWFKILRNSFKILKFVINRREFRKIQSKFCLNALE